MTPDRATVPVVVWQRENHSSEEFSASSTMSF